MEKSGNGVPAAVHPCPDGCVSCRAPFGEQVSVPLADHYVWDVLATAIAIGQTVVKEEVTMPVDGIDPYGPACGTIMACKGVGPEGTRKARIILTADEEKIWNRLHERCGEL
jgi:inosine-uridine nucleoside N-ribohydrolase